MCGILGFKINSSCKQDVLKKMISVMYHRGPDNIGMYINHDTALGHLRLKIIDLSKEADQPFSNETGDIYMVANGEIYNFKELHCELESYGHVFKSKSDNEVIIHSYEEWNTDCLKRLRGMFSFCIWDNTKKQLFLARDRFGIKPLYYYFKNRTFIFSSEVRAILATGLISKEINFKGVETFLRYGGIKEPWTIFHDIYSLSPGHFMLLKDDDLKIYRYYELLNREYLPLDLKEKELFEKLNFLLKEVMNLHYISDVPIVIFLSGGIDSASLVSLASEVRQSVNTVSLVFKEKDFDEERYSTLTAEMFNTKHYKVYIGMEDIIKELDFFIDAMDEPTFNGINTYFVSKVAKELGFKVGISGLGGDEIFCGYPSFRRIYNLIIFNQLLYPMPEFIKKTTVYFLSKFMSDTTYFRKLIDFIKYHKIHPYFWIRKLFTEDEVSRLLKNFHISEEEKNFVNYNRIIKRLDPVNQITYLELSNYMVDILLRDTDSMSMRHSIEIRVPYLDHKLVEFVWRIPAKFKIDKKIPKPILIKSLNKSLPPQIYFRPKKGFVLPIGIWMREDLLKNKIEEVFFSNDAFLDKIINPLEIKAVWKGFLLDRITWQRPWALYVLKRWLNKYLK